MSILEKMRQYGQFPVAGFTAALLLGTTGCEQTNGGVSAEQGRRSAAGDVQPAPAQPAMPSPAVASTAQTAAASPVSDSPDMYMSDDDRRMMAQDLIYTRIRIKMEEMIAQRSTLLKQGKDPADPEIRQLEGSIMRARELLTEAGEKVEDVQPPIVQLVPKQ
jgi:hypothetical protein